MNYNLLLFLIALVIVLSLLGYFGYNKLSNNKYDDVVKSFKEQINKCSSFISVLKDVEPMNFHDLIVIHKEIISYFPNISSINISESGYFRGFISLDHIYISKKLFDEDISLQKVINTKSQKEILASWNQYKSIIL